MYFLDLKRVYSNQEEANNVLMSVKEELLNNERVSINGVVKGKDLIINITSKDITGLKASFNTILRYLKASEDIILSDI